jgi:hypothetical protein
MHQVRELLQQVLDAHGLSCGAVITANGEVAVRAGDFKAFASAGLVSALLGPSGSPAGTFAGLAGQPLPQMWGQGEEFAVADRPSADLAVVVFGRDRLPILEQVARSTAIGASIRAAFGRGPEPDPGAAPDRRV